MMEKMVDVEEQLKQLYEDALCLHLEHTGKKFIKNRHGLFFNKY